MPGQGFLQLLFPWARNFTPIASATQLLNREPMIVFMKSGHSWRVALVADAVIPVEKMDLKKNFSLG